MIIREVTRETWRDFEALFESRGGPKSCWCMVWRATAEEARHSDGPSRKEAMRRRVQAGVPVGLVAYVDGRPIAWCSIAPHATYRRSMAPARPGDEREAVWSLVCFFVTRAYRGQGVLVRLIEAARALAKARCATVLEAYPVDEDSPSYRFGGLVPSFTRVGFVEVARAGRRRRVLRLRPR